jgi:hypothetical protein
VDGIKTLLRYCEPQPPGRGAAGCCGPWSPPGRVPLLRATARWPGWQRRRAQGLSRAPATRQATSRAAACARPSDQQLIIPSPSPGAPAGVHLADHLVASRPAAEQQGSWESWEGKGAFLYHLDLASDAAIHMMTLAHYCHVWFLHGLSFHVGGAVAVAVAGAGPLPPCRHRPAWGRAPPPGLPPAALHAAGPALPCGCTG